MGRSCEIGEWDMVGWDGRRRVGREVGRFLGNLAFSKAQVRLFPYLVNDSRAIFVYARNNDGGSCRRE